MEFENFYKEVIDGENHTLLSPPHNYTETDGRVIFNFHLNATAMIAHGWRAWTDAELDAWHAQYDPVAPVADTTAFDAACAQFREVCATIGATIGKSDFKGGFDEYADFLDSDYAKSNPAQAAMLATMWSGANEYAKYEGAKLGYGQPAWWYYCWSVDADGATNEQ